MREKPLVSIIIPCRNEEGFISGCLDSVVSQDYPRDRLDVLVVDGMSEDGTREKVLAAARKEPRVVLLDNPRGTAPAALNVGIRKARGKVIVRIDAHALYAPDYVSRCVEVLERTGADNVGGAMRVLTTTPFERAVALATGSAFGVGGARFHFEGHEGYVDTVYLGAYRKEVFAAVGAFDEAFVRNQDDEFNLRLTRAGGRIYMSRDIKSWYFPRSSPRRLWRQYFQYGYYKALVIKKHRVPASARHIVPGAFVSALIGLPVAGAFEPALLGALWAMLAAYAFFASIFTARLCADKGWRMCLLVPAVFLTLHVGYGLGFLKGVADFVVRGKGTGRRR